MADDGVVGCVESFSDGACEVTDVSDLATSGFAGVMEGMGEASAGRACGSATICSGVGIGGFVNVLCGSSTGTLED